MTGATPTALPNARPGGFASDADVVARLLDHVANSTTDLGEEWLEPVEHYRDPERFRAELAVVRRLPSVFAPAAAIAGEGDYLARDAIGVPLVAVRGRDGRARVLRNSCRHRGATVADGDGCARAFVCGYHGWTYRLDGSIAHIPHADGFPDDIAEGRSLVELPSCEANELVIIAGPGHSGEPTATGLQQPELLADTLADHRFLSTSRQELPLNWKVLVEQFLEGYHIRSTHRSTFYPLQYDNLNVVEFSGPHSRVTYPYRNVERLAASEPADRALRGYATVVTHLFPNAIVATFPERTLVAIVDPLDVERSALTTFALSTSAASSSGDDVGPRDGDEGASLVAQGAAEDNEMSLAVQRGLHAGANETLVFGRNESALGHFHRRLDALLDELRSDGSRSRLALSPRERSG